MHFTFVYRQFGKLLGSIYGNHFLARYPLNSQGNIANALWTIGSSRFLSFRGNKLIDFNVYKFIISEDIDNKLNTITFINLLS